MRQEIFLGTMLRVEHRGDVSLFPQEDFTVEQAIEAACGRDWDSVTVEREEGYWGRMSAPGYLDCTEWSGPYASEEEAQEDLESLYGEEEEEEEEG